MSLTVTDLPAILADLARLDGERFKTVPTAGGPRMYTESGVRLFLSGRSDAFDLAIVQVAVQEAILARGWDFEVKGGGSGVTYGKGSDAVAVVFVDAWHEVRHVGFADLPAVALAGAYRDALLAQQGRS